MSRIVSAKAILKGAHICSGTVISDGTFAWQMMKAFCILEKWMENSM